MFFLRQPLPQGYFTGLCSISFDSLGSPRPFLQSFLDSQPPSTGAWGYFSPGAGLCTCLCWPSWNSFSPISPTCHGLFEWQHSHLIKHSSELLICYELAEGALCSIIYYQIIVLAPVLTSQHTTSDWPPDKLYGVITTFWAQQFIYFSVHLLVHLSNAHFISLSTIGSFGRSWTPEKSGSTISCF